MHLTTFLLHFLWQAICKLN